MFDENKIQIIKSWLGSGSINIFGMPFAGKDTQCKFLAQVFGGVIIGGGDITRSQGSQELRQQTEAGYLAPTEEFQNLVLPYFSREEFKGKPLILSSVGRWIGEEWPVIQSAAQAGHEIKAAIFIKVDIDKVWTRWEAAQSNSNRGVRFDDDKDKLSVRLEEFKNKTLPVLDVYKSKNLLIEVNGNNSPQKVTEEILDKFLALAS